MRDCLSRNDRKDDVMTPDMMTMLIATGGIVVTLGTLIVSLFLWLRADMHHMRNELKGDINALDTKVADLGERMAHLGERMARVEGKLEFLGHYITRQNEPPPAAAE